VPCGIRARQRAVLLGTFNGYELTDNDNGYDAATMVAQARSHFGGRLYTGLPFGHTPGKLKLPVGGRGARAVGGGPAGLVRGGQYARNPAGPRSVCGGGPRGRAPAGRRRARGGDDAPCPAARRRLVT